MCKISNYIKIFLFLIVINFNQIALSISVSLLVNGQYKEELFIESNMRVGEIKGIITAMIGECLFRYELYYNNQIELSDDNRTFEGYGIEVKPTDCIYLKQIKFKGEK